MGLKEDMHTLGRYIEAGLGEDYVNGVDLPPLPPESYKTRPLDFEPPRWTRLLGDRFGD